MSTDTQTLRERFEKKHPVPNGVGYYANDEYVWIGGNHHGILCDHYHNLWKGYQSGAEDNQCVVELPKDPLANGVIGNTALSK